MPRRTLRSRRGAADRVSQLLDDDNGVMLDFTEQAEVVHALEAAHATQSNLWRVTLSALGFALGAALVWFGIGQARRPWVGYRHHSVFHRTAPAGLVAAAEVLSGAAALLSAVSLSVRVAPRVALQLRRITGDREDRVDPGAVAGAWCRQRESLLAWHAQCVALGLTVFWSWLLCASWLASRVTSSQTVKLLWLPFGPLLYAVLVMIVLRMLQNTEVDIAALRRQMYVFNKA